MSVLRLRQDGLFWRDTGGEVIALDALASRYFSANPSATGLWRLLSEGATESDLVDTLCERYGVARETAEADVAAFVAELTSRDFLERD